MNFSSSCLYSSRTQKRGQEHVPSAKKKQILRLKSQMVQLMQVSKKDGNSYAYFLIPTELPVHAPFVQTAPPPQRLFQIAVYFDVRFEITDVFSPLKPNGTVSLPLGFPWNLSYEPQPVSRPCATVKIPPPSLAERSESFKCR